MTKELKDRIIFSTIAVLILYFLYCVRSILLPFTLGGIIAYLLGGITGWLEKKIKNRQLASLIVVSIFFIILVVIFAIIIPLLLMQMIELMKELSGYLNDNNRAISGKISKILKSFAIDTRIDIKKYLIDYGKSITSYAVGFLNNILSRSIAFITVVSLLIITPITAYYFLSEWNKIIKIISLYLPKKNSKKIKSLFRQIDSVLSACIKGQLNVCVILGLFYGILLMFTGLSYGFIIGLFTGIASFIPYFGMVFGFITAMVMTLYQFSFDPTHIILTISIFVAGQILEGNFITPKLVGKKINLHPLWIIFAVFSGGTLFGFKGLLLSLPVAGVIGVLVRFYIKETISKNVYERKNNK